MEYQREDEAEDDDEGLARRLQMEEQALLHQRMLAMAGVGKARGATGCW